ncbi:MAG: 5-formyltetrahydrofolate cyclo-ligase [bacterium]|nr:MAG: 5-formyltetrahydrofolate cyclo-ligase [bacterium]
MDISEEKRIIRERVRALRESLSPEEVREAGLAVSGWVRSSPRIEKAGTLCVYASTAKEIPTRDIIRFLLDSGKCVAVPDWEGWKQGSGIRLAGIADPSDLQEEGRIVPQPPVTRGNTVSPEDVEIFIIPGLAFDHAGNRLGMGGGYFDRLLALASTKAAFLGLAYEFQVLAHLPSEPHDIPVHHVVTPGEERVGKAVHKKEGMFYGS